MMNRILKLLAGAMLVLTAAEVASAQTPAEFAKAFSGEWQIVDNRFTSGAEACRLQLQGEATEGRYPVESSGCAAEAGLVKNWGLADGQMTLLDAEGKALARLGGNQRRMSGSTASGAPVILERVGVAGTAAVLDAARRQAGCFYAGFTDKCAPDDQMGKPAGESPRVKVLVNLNARAEAREDAPIVGVVPANTCIQTELCISATDGVWCRAQFDNKTAWLRKFALRQGKWPVVTFFNTCPAQ